MFSFSFSCEAPYRQPRVGISLLPPTFAAARNAQVKLAQHEIGVGPAPASVATFAEIERALIARALQNNNGNKVYAAAELKISRKKLYVKIAKYGFC